MIRGLTVIAVAAGLFLAPNAQAAAVRIGSVSASVDGERFTDEQLQVRAAPGERNHVAVRPAAAPGDLDGEDAIVTDRVALIPGAGCRRDGSPHRVRCHFRVPVGESIDRLTGPPLRVELDDGDDSFHATQSAEIHGGPGDDVLTGGFDDSVLDGGPGDDRLTGRASNDVYDGGRTRDGADTFVLRSEHAIVDYRGRRTPVALSLDGARNDGAASERDRLVAGRGTVDLYGGSRGDVLRTARDAGGALYGGAGADTLVGGRGGDTLVADADVERPGRSRDADRLYGGGGDDRLVGNAGANALRPGPGKDRVAAGRGDDVIRLRDRQVDDVLCGTGQDRVLADVEDERRRGSACERFARPRPPFGVLDLSSLDGTGFLDADQRTQYIPVACPVDAVGRCRGEVRLLRGRTLVARGRFSVARGQTGGSQTRFTPRTLRDDSLSGRVTVELRARDRSGTVRRTRSRGWEVAAPI